MLMMMMLFDKSVANKGQMHS